MMHSCDTGVWRKPRFSSETVRRVSAGMVCYVMIQLLLVVTSHLSLETHFVK